MRFDNDLAQKIIIDLVKEELIPSDGFWQIQEHHLNAYIKFYNMYKNGGSKMSSSNYRYARKLAGLTLLKFKQWRGAKSNQCKEGFVYTVSNPAWINYLKVGMSVDIKKRLQNYQTYSPHRDYKLTNYEFVFNRKNTEQSILNKFQISLESGEWIKDTLASDIMDYIRTIPQGPYR